ncbi:hypothetical protein F5B17DRAFT_404012 [Nemania serpens]|nr:hypothetical protein F5B17DRAFT_404012 [Nemania serpens]
MDREPLFEIRYPSTNTTLLCRSQGFCYTPCYSILPSNDAYCHCIFCGCVRLKTASNTRVLGKLYRGSMPSDWLRLAENWRRYATPSSLPPSRCPMAWLSVFSEYVRDFDQRLRPRPRAISARNSRLWNFYEVLYRISTRWPGPVRNSVISRYCTVLNPDRASLTHVSTTMIQSHHIDHELPFAVCT